MSRWGASLAVLLLAACASTPVSDEADIAKIDRLLKAVGARLEQVPDIARLNWTLRTPITDPAVEAALIDAAVNRSQRYTVPPEVVRDFVRAQFDAAARIQAELHTEWQSRSAASEPAEAHRSPASTRIPPIEAELLEALGDAYPIVRRSGGRVLLTQRTELVLARVPGGARATAIALAPLWRWAN